MTNDWHEIYISDKSGEAFFKVTASPLATFSEIRNLKQHIEAAKRYRLPIMGYGFLDVDSAHIVLDGERYSEPTADELDAILDELKE